MAATGVNARWQAEMSRFFVADGPPDQNFRRLAEIFHLDLFTGDDPPCVT
jgi:L-rhamnose mutarotase